ncbi:M56 family metallopeptidase [Paenibacillus puldeungensis]|uniref:M56 family metallopeptidase n=1 Tax=Paenibacillus puldeungensis TaxID=696536 RepID=A0ABW3RRU5_9BACL
MNDLLKTIVSLSISGAIVALVLLLCRPLYRNRISRTWQYYIWLVVIARLLLPFTPESSPVGDFLQKADNTISAQLQQIHTISSTSDPTADAIGADDITQNQPQSMSKQQENTPVLLLTILEHNLWTVWLAIVLTLLIRKITMYQSFVRHVKAGRVKVFDENLLNRLTEVCEQNRVKRAIELYTNEMISSPMLIGAFHPFIVLPHKDIPDRDIQYIMLHELTHYRRLDVLYKWLVQITICIHWFNPLVYFMSREISRSCELSCDEAIIKKQNADGKQAYGDTLLNAVKMDGNFKKSVASVTFSESKMLLKERLGAIMSYKKKSKLAIAMTLVLTLCVSVGATAVGAYAHQSKLIPLPKDTTSVAKNTVQVNVEHSNIILMPSVDSKFHYDYDHSIYEIDTKTNKGSIKITVKPQRGKLDEFDWTEDQRIIIYVPEHSFDKVSVNGKAAGISVLALNTNLDLVNSSGAMSIYIPQGFDKNVSFSTTKGSGALRISESATDYTIKVANDNIQNSAIAAKSEFPTYQYNKPYMYKDGDGQATINLDIQESSFLIEKYSGSAEDLLSTHFDMVLTNIK